MNKLSRTFRAGGLAAVLAALVLTGCGLSPDPETRIAKARDYRADGELQAAVIELKNALQQDPVNLEARVLLGEVSLEAGDAASALKEFERAVELGADVSSFRAPYAEALRDAGSPGALLDLLEGATGATVEETGRLAALRAEALMRLGRMGEAGVAMDAAVAAAPGRLDVRLAQARYLLASGERDAAAEVLDSVASAGEGDDHYWEARGQLEMARGAPAAAAEAYRRGMQAAAGATFGVRRFLLQGGLAEALLGGGDVTGARAEVGAMLQAAERHPLPNYLMARIEYQDGNYAEALARAQGALAAHPEAVQALVIAGAAALNLGQAAQAERYLADAVRVAPTSVPARQLLAQARLGRGAPDEAMQALLPAFEAGSRDASLYALLGQVSVQAGDPEAAIAAYRRRLAEDPGDDQLRLYLAASLLAAGRNDEASAELEQAMGGDADQRLRGQLLNVIARIRDGDVVGARVQADEIRAEHSADPGVRKALGTAFLAAGAPEEARTDFEAALAAVPSDAEARLNLARLDALAGDVAAARAGFDAVLAADPDNEPAMLALAVLAQVDEDGAAADAWLEKARAASPDAIQPRLLLAERRLAAGEYDAAAELATEAAAIQSGNAPAANLLGVARAGQGDPAAARDAFRRATELAPTWAAAHYNLARVQLGLGDVAAGRRSLEQAVALEPGYANALVLSTELAVRERRLADAEQSLKGLQAAAPDAPITLMAEGAVRLAQGRPREALAAYRAVLESTGAQAAAFGVYAAARAAGETNPAAVLVAWLEANPEDSGARLLLAEDRHSSGDVAGAIAQYEAIIAAEPDNAVALNNVAVLYQEAGDPRAVEAAEKAYALEPESGAVADTLGWILHQRGERERALELLEEAAELAPQMAEIRYHLAVARADADDGAGARELAEQLLADESAVAFHDEAQALLERLRR